MTNHTNHFHDNTSRARGVCRKVQDALDLAESLGLSVQHERTEDPHQVQQATISEGDLWWHTKLLLTWSSYGLTVTRMAATKTENIPSTQLISWIETLGTVAKL